jgi:hypothetical protein
MTAFISPPALHRGFSAPLASKKRRLHIPS